jgi:hypothetical protein
MLVNLLGLVEYLIADTFSAKVFAWKIFTVFEHNLRPIMQFSQQFYAFFVIFCEESLIFGMYHCLENLRMEVYKLPFLFFFIIESNFNDLFKILIKILCNFIDLLINIAAIVED